MRWIARTALIAAAGLMVVAMPSQAQDKEKPKKGDRNTIILPEIQAREDLKTALEVAKQLRPQWFRAGARSEPGVYIDNMRQTSLSVLRELRSTEVVEMKFMEAQKAMALYDDTHSAGAIFVKTTRMP